jgi:HK97 family phage portal protein
MRWFGKKEVKVAQFEEVLMRLIAAREGIPGEMVTPKTCLAAPTVQAIDTAINRRLSVTPVHVYEKYMDNGKPAKRKLPDHPISKLLARPNSWQSTSDFMADASSTWVRWGNFYAWKVEAAGKIQELLPLDPGQVEPKLEKSGLFYKLEEVSPTEPYPASKLLHARGRAVNFIEGDSPIKQIQTAIMMEILAEKYGESFFRNGALPLTVFQYMAGFGAFKTEEEEQAFVDSFKAAFGGAKRFNAMLVPHGLELKDPIAVENDKAQFIESRKLQRTIIAGALGVPVTLAGDIERATFNNVEQMAKDFDLNVILPVAKSFETAMERDLLTEQDRNNNVIIRFNMDSTLRAAFKERQEGLKIQREMGVINPDEWRELEGKNPRADSAGGEYWDQGPSGQGANDAES